MDPVHIFIAILVTIDVVVIVLGLAEISKAIARQNEALKQIAEIASRNERLTMAVLGRLPAGQGSQT